jgi:hypothetical protein
MLTTVIHPRQVLLTVAYLMVNRDEQTLTPWQANTSSTSQLLHRRKCQHRIGMHHHAWRVFTADTPGTPGGIMLSESLSGETIVGITIGVVAHLAIAALGTGYIHFVPGEGEVNKPASQM